VSTKVCVFRVSLTLIGTPIKPKPSLFSHYKKIFGSDLVMYHEARDTNYSLTYQNVRISGKNIKVPKVSRYTRTVMIRVKANSKKFVMALISHGSITELIKHETIRNNPHYTTYYPDLDTATYVMMDFTSNVIQGVSVYEYKHKSYQKD